MTCDQLSIPASVGCPCAAPAELYFTPTFDTGDFAVGVLRARCTACGREAAVEDLVLDEELWLG